MGFVLYVYKRMDDTNSPAELMNTRRVPDTMEGMMSGRMIFRNVRLPGDPSVSAASCIEG